MDTRRIVSLYTRSPANRSSQRKLEHREYKACASPHSPPRKPPQLHAPSPGKVPPFLGSPTHGVSLSFLVRHPHHDVHVQRGARVRVHPIRPADGALPLPWAVLRCSLHPGGVPPAALREAPGATPERGHPSGFAPQRQGGTARLPCPAVPRHQPQQYKLLKWNSWELMCNKVLLLSLKSQKNTWR